MTTHPSGLASHSARIAQPAATYFSRQKLIAQQTIEKKLEDGGLIVSGKVAHTDRILSIVRHWMPHVRIVSPATWHEELESGLRGYLLPKCLIAERQ